ncbi:hypothetical protein U1Q18_022444, partial [Sarracenia purpurea var. burkii]
IHHRSTIIGHSRCLRTAHLCVAPPTAPPPTPLLHRPRATPQTPNTRNAISPPPSCPYAVVPPMHCSINSDRHPTAHLCVVPPPSSCPCALRHASTTVAPLRPTMCLHRRRAPALCAVCRASQTLSSITQPYAVQSIH